MARSIPIAAKRKREAFSPAASPEAKAVAKRSPGHRRERAEGKEGGGKNWVLWEDRGDAARRDPEG